MPSRDTTKQKNDCAERRTLNDERYFLTNLFHLRILGNGSIGCFVKNLVLEPEEQGNKGRDKEDSGEQIIFEKFQPALPGRVSIAPFSDHKF
jgi:hypothetical protein